MAYGRYGVDVFFVISGFIVPYAMARAGYTLGVWPRFIARRLIRLEPPYLVSIAAVIVIGLAASLTPWFKGQAPQYDPLLIAAHVGYFNAFLGTPWLNPVYWSLAIEFQYYLLIGLLLPALLVGSQMTRLAIVALLVATPSILPVGGWFVAFYLPVFSAGILTFLLAQRLISTGSYWAALAVLFAYMALRSDSAAGLTTTAVTIATAIIIVCVRLPHIRVFAWLGAISYSLYLLHAPVGAKVTNIIARFGISQSLEVIAILLSLTSSLAAAYVLYILVERPSQDAAKMIPYAPSVVTKRAAAAGAAQRPAE
jgi:peptidoglycan/LPS O-acetylase OafA/YrhL